jgi:threonine dehydrogenase-like Zn-dependent dehydrogenase
MKAVVFDDGLKLETNYPLPVPKSGEALIKVLLCGICNTDYEITKGYMGYHGVLGHEFVGVVEECEDKTLIGKRVVGEINNACESCEMCHQGLQRHCPNRQTLGIWKKDGCFSEYMTWSVKELLEVPDNVSNEQAVFVEPLAAALEILEQVHIQPIQKVIVLGDGKLGLTTALALNACNVDVTLVGKHQNKLAIASLQGVKTCLLNNLEVKKKWDFVIEATGSVSGFETALALTKPRGTLILKSTVAASKEFNLAPIVIDEIRVQGSRCGRFAPALKLLQANKIDFSPMISGVFDVNDALLAFEKNKEKDTLKILLKF